VGLPRLPGAPGAATDAYFSTPRMSIIDGTNLRDGNPIAFDASLQKSRDDWWNWDVTERFGECLCVKEVEGEMTGEECQQLFGPGCDENNPKKCQKDKDCKCRMNVWNYNVTTAQWSNDRSHSQCQKTSQKNKLISDYAYGGFALVVKDCSTQKTAAAILHKLTNLTGLRFECTSIKSKNVPTHADIDDVVYNGYYHPLAVGANAKVEGVVAALAFKEVNSNKLQVTLMYNNSQSAFPFGKRGQEVRVHNRKDRILAPLNALLRSYVAEELGTDSEMLIDWKDFPASPAWGSAPDIGSAFGPFLITITFLVLLPSMVVTHVQEKVLRIRIMMKMMGLGTTAYWFISYVFWFVIMFVFAMVFMLLANVSSLHTTGYKIGMFQNVNCGVQFVFFLLYSMNLVSFAFFLSTLANSVRVAQVGTILFIVVSVVLGLVFEGVGDIWNSSGVSEGTRTFVSLFPSMCFYRGMVTFRAHTGDEDMDHSGTMAAVLCIMAVEAVTFMLLALYLDQVAATSDSYGVSQHPLFCLGFGKESNVNAVDHAQDAQDHDDDALEHLAHLPNDVKDEYQRVHGMAAKAGSLSQSSIVTMRLRKVYPGGKEAVKGLSLAIQRGECFGMLGPNGAGKTTSINMLVGFSRPTSGTAVVERLSILTHMKSIYSIMGVCPQHDILWESLSPREHLSFYGALKNLSGQELTDAIHKVLSNVDLCDVIDIPAGTFSGGMKRRLSVAISLIGRPLVCYLDEPSTGLDPANRRLLWDCIKRAKASRTMLLTTHSMEEASFLCDRLTIFVAGEMQCVGAPKTLTMRYAGIYNITVTTASANQMTEVNTIIASLCPSFHLTYSLATTSKYELPADKVTLEQIFARMLAARAAGTITSWGVSSATLEDAFIKISQAANTKSVG
jgi:ABC-type multidrug transport system ATPase subunit